LNLDFVDKLFQEPRSFVTSEKETRCAENRIMFGSLFRTELVILLGEDHSSLPPSLVPLRVQADGVGLSWGISLGFSPLYG
jgi:hypothetical protein